MNQKAQTNGIEAYFITFGALDLAGPQEVERAVTACPWSTAGDFSEIPFFLVSAWGELRRTDGAVSQHTTADGRALLVVTKTDGRCQFVVLAEEHNSDGLAFGPSRLSNQYEDFCRSGLLRRRSPADFNMLTVSRAALAEAGWSGVHECVRRFMTGSPGPADPEPASPSDGAAAKGCYHGGRGPVCLRAWPEHAVIEVLVPGEDSIVCD